MEDDGLGPGPEPMSHSSPAIFQVVKKGTPRLGKLTFPGRAPILTPHHVVPTSRGIVPHITPDNLKKHTAVTAVHVALEDCRSIASFPEQL